MSEIEEDEDEYWERFGAEAKNAYAIWWMESHGHERDSEESDKVFVFDGQYFIWMAFEDDPQGPYVTLEAAILAGELNHVYEFNFQIDAPTLSDESLQGLLYYAGTLKHTLTVNGKKWRTKAGRKLEPVPEEDTSRAKWKSEV